MKEFDKRFGKDFILSVPATPGIYRYYGENGILVYVGKAKNLRRRLSQYRNAKRCKAQIKMRKVLLSSVRLEFEPSTTEMEAELLETKLIQLHRPKWNVVGAYSFLYPQIGISSDESGGIVFAYTTSPGKFPGFEFHGSFRSKKFSKEAFFGLVSILRFHAHPLSRKDLAKMGKLPEPKTRGGFIYGFRNAKASLARSLTDYFRGVSFSAIEELSLELLEHPDAIRKRSEVQEYLLALKRFWKHEILNLKGAIERSGHAEYPVNQTDRDLVFILARSRGVARKHRPKPKISEKEAKF